MEIVFLLYKRKNSCGEYFYLKIICTPRFKKMIFYLNLENGAMARQYKNMCFY
nr:MAG TPA: hypothetical protein [Caudoviricetes sp.]